MACYLFHLILNPVQILCLVCVHLVSRQSLYSVCQLLLSVCEQKFRVKNVKGETNVGKETHIPYISHKAIINVPSQNPCNSDMGDMEGPCFSAAGPEVLWVV